MTKRTRHLLPCLFACVGLTVSAGSARSGEPIHDRPGGMECNDVTCHIDQAMQRMAADDATGAVAGLKDALVAFPGDASLTVLLGAAYLAAGNDFWAIRTLSRRVAEAPEDCAARAWLAWAYLGQAGLDQALDAAIDPGCQGPDAGRLAMVRALVAGNRGDGVAADDALRAARKVSALWPSDRDALGAVTRRALPDGMPELSWRLEVAGGYTSNALLGSPSDPLSGSVRDGRSALGQTDLWLRFAPWVHTWVRPLAELQFKGAGFLADEVRGLSWLDLTGRLGLVIGRGVPRAMIAWRPEGLLLGQGDRYDAGPVWYFAAHRAELEVEVTPWLVLFAGGGQRTFRETARTRGEADLGLGGHAVLARPLILLWAATGRVYRANEPAWHLWGGSALVALQGRLPLGFLVKGGLSASLDFYPDSAGYAPFGAPSRDRRDLFLKPGLSSWSPAWSGVRVGVQYDFSWRDSTAPAYDFSDHRVTLRVSWSGNTDVLRPRAAEGRPLGEMPWGVGRESEVMDRVQDLLRQDEQVQRSSSCVQ